jgi:hypothetical protein
MAAKEKSQKKARESQPPNASPKPVASVVELLGTEKASTGEAKPKKSKQEKREKKEKKAARATKRDAREETPGPIGSTVDIHSFASDAEVQAALAAVAKVKRPELPVHRLVSEARDVVFAAKKDVAELHRIRFDLALVPLISALASALEHVQSRIEKARDAGRSEADVKAESDARTFRERTLETLEYALRGDESARERISDVREGSGLDDLLDDVGVVVDFVEEASVALIDIGADPAALASEGRTHQSLLSKVVHPNRAPSSDAALDAERDRIATALSAAVAKLYAAGRYAFRDHPKRARKYASAHTRVRGAAHGALTPREETKANTTGRRRSRREPVPVKAKSQVGKATDQPPTEVE